MNVNVTTTPKNVYVKVCEYLYSKEGDDLLKHNFSFISNSEFLNKTKTIAQNRKVTYTQIKLGNVFFKTHFRNSDIIDYTKKLIKVYPNYNIILIDTKDGNINLIIKENKSLASSNSSLDDIDKCIVLYNEYLDSGFMNEIDFPLFLKIRKKLAA